MSLQRTAPLIAAVLACLVLHAGVARAESNQSQPLQLTPTFSYTTDADAHYLRALLEMSGVMAFGFIWYVTGTRISQTYDVSYTWPVFRKKLSGEALGFDTNHFGTNFIGHPLGGLGYYLSARSNRVGIGQSLGFAIGGSLLWEYFGEVSERVSVNDMIVTPLAGIALAEPWTQLGAFFDRSRPSLHNRVLGTFFAPLKTINDQLDGLTLARAAAFDRYGFPTNEWHELNLNLTAASTWQSPLTKDGRYSVSPDVRFAFASRLARLPEYADDGHHSLAFDDGNVSSIELEVTAADAGVVDFNLATQVVTFGHYLRNTTRSSNGGLWGHGFLVGLTTGYQYSVHDFDRELPRPVDKVSNVQPLGLVLEHRGELGFGHVLTRLETSASFGGVTPYALMEYRAQTEPPPNPDDAPAVLNARNYYFAFGEHVTATLGLAWGVFEAVGKFRFESYSQVGSDLTADDQRTRLSLHAGVAIPGTPLRITALAERRSRAGSIDRSHAARNELSSGLALGARF